MKIAIGSDHAGFLMKSFLVDWLKKSHYEIFDVGTDGLAPVDYPDFSKKVADAVATGLAERGIVICGSGVGANVAVNKVKGIRGSICHDTYSAHQGVEHDDMNVLVLGGRVIGENLAQEIVNTFLKAKFSPEERYVRRINKILAIEKNS